MSAVHVPKQLQPTFLTVRHSPTYATDFASSLPANTSYLCNHPAQPRRASTCRSDGRQAGASLGFPQSQSKVARELWASLGIRTTCGRAVAELRRTAPVRPTVSLQPLSCSERNLTIFSNAAPAGAAAASDPHGDQRTVPKNATCAAPSGVYSHAYCASRTAAPVVN